MRRLAALLVLLATPAVAQEQLRGTWRGSYVCAQGHTALALTIEPDKPGTFSAFFHFEAPSDNPGVPTGCYEMQGRFDPTTRQMVLNQRRWVLKPPNYVMVDLSGQLSPGGDRIEGQVHGPFCATFQVDRAPGPPAAEACRRGEPVISLR
ncbi:hypothetical protein GXW78_27225 [Roseomonas terrae]|uniref:DUF2147 domain-containing protein n=1 Tax=Neoroseomonas terrae TaxID=424799 RepID=A0ABS5EQQ4_9PROT|nr:hypothetical protein [Neoroseomonas terrae]MBR0653373.1 hypothetical protein [Neoroseomonas terrae]